MHQFLCSTQFRCLRLQFCNASSDLLVGWRLKGMLGGVEVMVLQSLGMKALWVIGVYLQSILFNFRERY